MFNVQCSMFNENEIFFGVLLAYSYLCTLKTHVYY